MKKLIGDISKLTGLSVSGIRYYEERGVVKPVRRGKYRYYSDEDLMAINRAVNYRAMGFSLSDSAEMANIDNMDEFYLRLEKRLEEIDKELQKMLEIQKNVRRRLMQVKFVRERGKLCTLEDNPHFIWMVGMRMKGRLIERFALDNYKLSAMLEPEAAPGFLIPLEEILSDQDEKDVLCGRIAEWGTGAASEILLRGNNIVREIVPVPCICAMTRIVGARSPSNEDISHVLEFAEQNDLEFCGDAFSQRAIAVKEQGEAETVFYNRFWFPVKKKEKRS